MLEVTASYNVREVRRYSQDSNSNDAITLEKRARKELLQINSADRQAVTIGLPPGQWENMTWVERLQCVQEKLDVAKEQKKIRQEEFLMRHKRYRNRKILTDTGMNWLMVRMRDDKLTLTEQSTGQDRWWCTTYRYAVRPIPPGVVLPRKSIGPDENEHYIIAETKYADKVLEKEIALDKFKDMLQNDPGNLMGQADTWMIHADEKLDPEGVKAAGEPKSPKGKKKKKKD